MRLPAFVSVCLSVGYKITHLQLFPILRYINVLNNKNNNKNNCMDLDEMLRVDRCRNMDELINF